MLMEASIENGGRQPCPEMDHSVELDAVQVGPLVTKSRAHGASRPPQRFASQATPTTDDKETTKCGQGHQKVERSIL